MTTAPQALSETRRALVDAISAIDVAAITQASALEKLEDPRLLAVAVLKQLRRRAAILPNLSPGAWTMLLDLYAHQETRPVSITSACIASGGPPTTALRWLQYLVTAGLIMRVDDKSDGRRRYLELTDRGHDAVLQYIRA